MRIKSLLFLSVLAICLLTAACPAPCEIQDNQVNAVYEELKPVEQAIENFKKAENKYPAKLDELAPRYLPKVPQKAGGREIYYTAATEGDKYSLRINSPNGGSYSGSCSIDDIEDRKKDLK